MSELAEYIDQFSRLRQDHNQNRYPETTLHASPHKPLLLLAVLDRFAEGSIEQNQIPLDPALGDPFSEYWHAVMPIDHPPNIALPFYHLTSEGFWHLIPSPGHEDVVESGRRLHRTRLLHDHTEGARLDEALFELMQNNDDREPLRRTLIETYFADDVHDSLYERGHVHEEAYRYSRRLLDLVRSEAEGNIEEPEAPARDKGFRRVVVEAYDHRCALSGIRILTADARTAVDAAHIIPWSESHNDDPRNGLALSKLCHWAFEEGLITISPEYSILTSPELTAPYNATGMLDTLDDRSPHLPEEEALWPDPEYLEQHNNQKFRD
jgi:putative restriction endonuclease